MTGSLLRLRASFFCVACFHSAPIPLLVAVVAAVGVENSPVPCEIKKKNKY